MSGSVLIVEDDVDLRESLRDILEDEGYHVEEAGNGQEAMSVLAQKHPCLVILDLAMPVMSGNEVYDAMRADPSLASIPVVVSTSDASAAPSGVLLMKKPVNLNTLLDTIAKFCR